MQSKMDEKDNIKHELSAMAQVLLKLNSKRKIPDTDEHVLHLEDKSTHIRNWIKPLFNPPDACGQMISAIFETEPNHSQSLYSTQDLHFNSNKNMNKNEIFSFNENKTEPTINFAAHNDESFSRFFGNNRKQNFETNEATFPEQDRSTYLNLNLHFGSSTSTNFPSPNLCEPRRYVCSEHSLATTFVDIVQTESTINYDNTFQFSETRNGVLNSESEIGLQPGTRTYFMNETTEYELDSLNSKEPTVDLNLSLRSPFDSERLLESIEIESDPTPKSTIINSNKLTPTEKHKQVGLVEEDHDLWLDSDILNEFLNNEFDEIVNSGNTSNALENATNREMKITEDMVSEMPEKKKKESRRNSLKRKLILEDENRSGEDPKRIKLKGKKSKEKKFKTDKWKTGRKDVCVKNGIKCMENEILKGDDIQNEDVEKVCMENGTLKGGDIQNDDVQKVCMENGTLIGCDIQNEDVQKVCMANGILKTGDIQNEDIQKVCMANGILKIGDIQNEVIQEVCMENKILKGDGIQNGEIKDEIIKNKVLEHSGTIKRLKNTEVKNRIKDCSTENGSIKVSKNNKRKPKFEPPKTLSVPKGITQNVEVISLNADNISELRDALRENMIEICFTLTYKEGISQLDSTTDDNNKTLRPNGLLFRLVYGTKATSSENDGKSSEGIKAQESLLFYYLPTSPKKWTDFTSPRNILLSLFGLRCRKICYNAQVMLVSLIKIFDFNRRDICLRWKIVDPLIGCWLLNPETSLLQFQEVLAFFSIKRRAFSKSDDTLKRTASLLVDLSACAEIMYQRLLEKELWRLYFDIEMKIIGFLAVMETRGFSVSIDELRENSQLLEKKLQEVEKKVYKSAGKVFQINSPLQLRNILYNDLKLDSKHGVKIKETSALKAKSTSEAVLRQLVPLHPLPGLVLQYRHIHKAKATFVDAMSQRASNDGVITCKWEQTAASTGRVTSSQPNLQNIPKIPFQLELFAENPESSEVIYLRRAFRPRSSHTLLGVDFQHLELRIFAHLSKCPILNQCFQENGDVFLNLAGKWLGRGGPGSVIGLEEREKTKRVVYSVLYGAGPFKLAELLCINTSEANNIISSFMNTFPALKTYSKSVVESARQGKWPTTIGGRIRPLPNINSTNHTLRGQAERQCVNFVIQGSAADLCKFAMIATEKRFQSIPELHKNIHILLQIHDEIIWEVGDRHLQQAKDIVLQSMHSLSGPWDKISIPLPVTLSAGNNWADMIVDSSVSN